MKFDRWFWGEYTEQDRARYGLLHQWRGFGFVHFYLGEWMLGRDK